MSCFGLREEERDEIRRLLDTTGAELEPSQLYVLDDLGLLVTQCAEAELWSTHRRPVQARTPAQSVAQSIAAYTPAAQVALRVLAAITATDLHQADTRLVVAAMGDSEAAQGALVAVGIAVGRCTTLGMEQLHAQMTADVLARVLELLAGHVWRMAEDAVTLPG